MASEGGGNRLRLMCVEKDKDFDEIKFMLSFRSSSSEVSFPTSMEELKQRTRDILQVLDRLQEEEYASSGMDTGKNKVMAEAMQKLHKDLELYQYIYARLRRMDALQAFVVTLRPQLENVRFLKDYCAFLVTVCETAVKKIGDKLNIFRFTSKSKSQTLKDYVTTDHLLLLRQVLQSAAGVLSLCTKQNTKINTFVLENHSDGLSSPHSNIVRRIRILLLTVGVSDLDLDLSQEEFRKFELAFQNAIFDWVSDFLKNPKEGLKKEFLMRLADDLATLKKQQKGHSVSSVSVTGELYRILEWASEHHDLMTSSISSAVDTAIQEKEEKEKEEAEEQAKTYSSSLESNTGDMIDMSDVLFNHITWANLNINQEIGMGAFALVYEAELAGERVAVKKIKDEVKDARMQLSNEVKVMSQLRSSYVVEMYGASFRPAQTIMVMEYLPRGSIFDVLNNPEERISWKMKWKFALEMAAGLNYIHTRQPPIVHRDLKTGNFLLSQGWRVKLCDFGLAIPIYPPPPPMNCGTVRWTAPEINDCQVYTTKSDVYSYGIILWEVAAREIPWKEETNDSTIRRVAKGDRPEIPPGTSISYQLLMSECWAQQPEHRPSFASILELLKQWGIVEWVESLQGEDNFEKIKIESEKLQSKAERQSQQRSELEERQNIADAKVRQFQRQKRDLRVEKDESERKLRDCTQKNNQLERQIVANSAKISEIEKQIRTYEIKAAENRRQIEEERQQDIQKITEELEEVKKKLSEEEEAVQSLTEKKERLQKEKDDLSRKILNSSPSARSLTPTNLRPL